MFEEKRLCMNCMKELSELLTICPECRYDNTTPQENPFLAKGTIIRERYLVGAVQSVRPDGITYIGKDIESGETVDITEFYPKTIVTRGDDGVTVNINPGYEEIFRDYLQSFLNLWRSLTALRRSACLPHIFEVADFNSTVYAIGRHKDCISLSEFFNRKTSPLPWKKAQAAFRPIVAALAILHGKDLCHGGISPDCICVGADGKLHLTGFSIPECYTSDSYIPAEPISGFAPLEYYTDEAVSGACSDVYSLTAVIYYSITGIIPGNAVSRAEHDDMVMPSSVASAMTRKELGLFVKGLALKTASRIPSAQVFYDSIYATPANAATTRKNSSENAARPIKTKETKAVAERITTKKATEGDENSIIPLMIKTFCIVLVSCIVIFTVLYSTVLYKSVDIPLFDKLLSPISFLPVNQNNPDIPEVPDDEYLPEESTSASNPYETFYVTVPDLMAETYTSIQENEVYNRDFNIKFKFESNADYEKDTVISQSLPKGESVPSGSDLTVVISSGVVQIELKDVTGMDFQIAKEQLIHLGFKVKKELAENDGTGTVGEVYMMSKVSGLEFDEGTEIVLYVWDEIKEPETTEETKPEKTTKKSEETTKKNETTTKKTETTTKKSETTTKKPESTTKKTEAGKENTSVTKKSDQ